MVKKSQNFLNGVIQKECHYLSHHMGTAIETEKDLDNHAKYK